MSTFKLPDLGEGLQDAEIVAWHVSAGDHVVADQPLVSVETAKAVVEIPSPQSGHIAKLLAAKKSHDEIMKEIYFAVLARPPTKAELKLSNEILKESANPKECYVDHMWALINSKHFLFVR